MGCEVCIHYGICVFHITENEYKKCPHFKNKADVADVVRCENCRWWKTNGCWYHQPGRCVEREPQDFCSDGVRGEGKGGSDNG